jgi:hypothetical protein
MDPNVTPDLFEAARSVVKTIEQFKEPEERKRIIRWAAETLSLPEPFSPVRGTLPREGQPEEDDKSREASAISTSSGQVSDIRSFIESKNPRSDLQFAAAVAYFYQFLAREDERRDAIDKDILRDAFRKANRKQPNDCAFTLVNATNAGLLDRKGKGSFSINAVGENLVTMTLPSEGNGKSGPRATSTGKKPAPEKRSRRAGTRKAR